MNGITAKHVATKLVSAPIFERDKKYWNALLEYEEHARQQLSSFGWKLILDRNRGYGYIQQLEQDDSSHLGEPLPVISRRVQLSKHQTILLIILRRKQLEHERDNPGSDEPLLMSFQEIWELFDPYLADRVSPKQKQKKTQEYLKRLAELKVVRRIENRETLLYHIETIIAAKVLYEDLLELEKRFTAITTDESIDEVITDAE